MNATELRRLKEGKLARDKKFEKEWSEFDKHCHDLLAVLDSIPEPIAKKSWWSGTEYLCPECGHELFPGRLWSQAIYSPTYKHYSCSCGYEYLMREKVDYSAD